MGVWSVWGRMRERCKSVNKCKWEANHSKWQPTGTHLIWWLAPAHLSFDRSHRILRKYCDNIAAAAIFAIFLLHKAPWSFFLIETLSIVTTSYENVLWSDQMPFPWLVRLWQWGGRWSRRIHGDILSSSCQNVSQPPSHNAVRSNKGFETKVLKLEKYQFDHLSFITVILSGLSICESHE